MTHFPDELEDTLRRLLLAPALALVLIGTPVLALENTPPPPVTSEEVPVATPGVEVGPGWESPITPTDATLVGVAWEGDPAASFKVEVQDSDGNWTTASGLINDIGADAGTAEAARVEAVGDQGTAPKKVIYLEGEKSKVFSKTPTQFMSLIPTVYNADTLGYRPDLVGRKIETWGELFNPEFKGKTAILDIPQIGIMDAAMVSESLGLMTFGDKGNMTKAEIDQIIEILKEQKANGQFRAFWKTFDESVNLMSSGEVVLQSMWSPAVTAVQAQGIECIYAPLKEGYRGWGGGIGLSKNLEGIQLDAAYEYMNWMLDGWVGAFLGRQGYYSAAPETARKFMSADEWGFWYEGKAATEPIVDPFGKTLAKAGAKRDGGSFDERFGNIVCWNSTMKENTYLVQKWNEFIAS